MKLQFGPSTCWPPLKSTIWNVYWNVYLKNLNLFSTEERKKKEERKKWTFWITWVSKWSGNLFWKWTNSLNFMFNSMCYLLFLCNCSWNLLAFFWVKWFLHPFQCSIKDLKSIFSLNVWWHPQGYVSFVLLIHHHTLRWHGKDSLSSWECEIYRSKKCESEAEPKWEMTWLKRA